jgi:hypothetical protein
MTLCGGSFSPFDFALSKMQHQQLFIAGQVSRPTQHTHTHTTRGSLLGRRASCPPANPHTPLPTPSAPRPSTGGTALL